MADTLDTLQIQIDSNAGDAFQGLDNFAKSLRKVASAMNRIDLGKINSVTSALGSLGNSISALSGAQFNTAGLNDLTSALSKFGNVGISKAISSIPFLEQAFSSLIGTLNNLQGVQFDTAGLASLINAISTLGSKKLNSAVSSLPLLTQGLTSLVTALNGMQGVNFDFSGLAQLVEALRTLGGKSAQTAVSGLDQLGVAMRKLMGTLATAPTVNQNIIEMTQALAQLASQGSKVGTVTRAITPSFPRLNSGMMSAHKSAFSLASAFGKLYASYWLILRAIRGLKGWVDLASSLTEIQNVVDHTFGNTQSILNDFTRDSIQKFGMSELSAKKAATRYQSMGVAMGLTGGMVKRANDNLAGLGKTVYNTNGSLADMSVNVTKLVADYASFYDMDQKDVAEKFDAIFTGQTRPLILAA